MSVFMPCLPSDLVPTCTSHPCICFMHAACNCQWYGCACVRIYHVQAEKHLSDMVVAGALAARIDRPAGIVKFAPRRAPAGALSVPPLSAGSESAQQSLQTDLDCFRDTC